MSIEVDQKQFISSYLQLVSLSDHQDASFFNEVNNYGLLPSLGPSLPSIRGVLPSASSNANVATVKLNFKSIKPPFKFQTDLEEVLEIETIFNVKIKLIDALKLNEQNVKPKDIKLLIKGKVIQDTEVVSNLASDSFMCMITQSANTANDDPEPSITAVASTDMDVDLRIAESTWSKIYELLKQDLKSEEKASAMLNSFKNAV